MPNKTQKRNSSGKRELISPRGDKRYAKRNAKGQFTEMDDQKKSLSRDIKRKAKTTVKAGYGDKGDQRERGKKS